VTPTSRIFHPEFIALIEKSRECSEEATRVEMEEITLIVGNIRGFWGHLVSAYGQGEQ